MISKEYREMAGDYIEWKKLYPKGLKARWDYFVKEWQKGWRPERRKKR